MCDNNVKTTIGILYWDVRYDFAEIIKEKIPLNYHVKKIKIDTTQCQCEFNFIYTQSEHERVLKEINSCDILVAWAVSVAPFLYEMTVKWVYSLSAGVEFMTNELVPGKATPSYVLTRFGGHIPSLIAEYVIGQIISSERRFLKLYDYQKDGVWENYPAPNKFTWDYRSLSLLSISILGVGDIGSEIAKHCKNFNMTVYGMVSKIPEDKKEFVDEYFTSKNLNEYLKKSDFICSILPKTPLTDNLLSGGILKNCRERQSVLINVGRGNVINEESILEALEKKWIKGAVLDVFEHEPLRADSPLWKHPDVIVTPHVSGVTQMCSVAVDFVSNLQLFEKGLEHLKYKVDWDKGY